MRLIDADSLKESVPETHVDIFENCRNCRLLDQDEVRDLIDDAPTVDAVEVVRCKDCKYGLASKDVWCELYYDTKSVNGFCDMGKRKDGGSDEG